MTSNRLICLALLAAAVAGIGVSIYLTSVHYASVPLACSSNGIIDCEQVLSSRYSEVLGLPLSLGGIVWFAVSGGFAAVALRRSPEPSSLHTLQLLWCLLGGGVAIYLVGVEVVALEHICIWCTSLHVLIGLTLLLTLFRTPDMVDERELDEAGGVP